MIRRHNHSRRPQGNHVHRSTDRTARHNSDEPIVLSTHAAVVFCLVCVSSGCFWRGCAFSPGGKVLFGAAGWLGPPAWHECELLSFSHTPGGRLFSPACCFFVFVVVGRSTCRSEAVLVVVLEALEVLFVVGGWQHDSRWRRD